MPRSADMVSAADQPQPLGSDACLGVLLMAQPTIGAQYAFALLVRASPRSNTKLRDVAAHRVQR